MNANRKRLREDEIGDLPLSKKMNSWTLDKFAPSVQENGENKQNVYPMPVTERKPSYDPGIHCSQSNYFYNNKLLFELHLERIQRNGQQHPW